MRERFLQLKLELNVPKNITNTFGGFKYRSKEQIQEALKPLEQKYKVLVDVDEDLVVVGSRIFIKATAFAQDVESGEIIKQSSAFAELQEKAGTKMNESQLTGSASSYAGKYALGNLLGIDDNKDGDDPNFTTTTQARVPVVDKTVVGQAPELNPDDRKTKLYEIGKETIQAKSADEINLLLKDVEALGGDKNTEMIINTRAKQLGFEFNGKTWEVK